MRFHHIGIAVKDIDEAAKKVVGSFNPVSGKVYDGGQQATLQMFDYCGVNVEFVEGRAVDAFLLDTHFKIYHVCLEVGCILDAIDLARKAGYIDISGIKPAPLFDGRPVVFMMNNDNFMIEFLEAEKKEKVRI